MRRKTHLGVIFQTEEGGLQLLKVCYVECGTLQQKMAFQYRSSTNIFNTILVSTSSLMSFKDMFIGPTPGLTHLTP